MHALFRSAFFAAVLWGATGCCRRGDTNAADERVPPGSSKATPPSSLLPAILGGPKEHAAPTSFAAPPFVAGASSRLRITKNGQPDGEQLVKILAVNGDQLRVEIERTDAKAATTIVGALLRLRDRRTPSGVDILEATLKRAAGAPLKLSGPQLKASQALLGNQFDVFAFPDGATNPRREDVTVPAGTFKGCLVADREGVITLPLLGARKTQTRTWYHPAVGTNGVVKQEATTNGEKQLTELVEMNGSGAKSSL